MKGMILLIIATCFEVFGTTMLKLSHGFTILLPTIGVVISFILALFSLGLSLKHLPLSFAYATWSGLGSALTMIIGIMVFYENMNIIKFSGLCLIIIGIFLMNTATTKEKDKYQMNAMNEG